MTSETPPKPFSEVTESQACKADIPCRKRFPQINIHNKKQRKKKKKHPEFLKSSRGCDSSEHTKPLKTGRMSLGETGNVCLSHSIRGSRADRC